MRLADADLLPFDFTALADTVSRYVKEIRDLAKDKREETEERPQIDEGVFEAVADPEGALRAAEEGAARSVLRLLSPRERRSIAGAGGAKTTRAASAGRPAGGTPRISPRQRALRSAERAMTREEGLPRRPWFKHYVYAPGFYTGYDVKTLPAVREAIEEKQWSDVNREIAKTAEAIEACAAKIREAARALRP